MVRAFWQSRTGRFLRASIVQLVRKGILVVALFYASVFAYERSDLMKAGVDGAASGIANIAVDFFYRHLNVVEDGELPVSATSYSYGPLMTSAIGGRGEGLNCSIPNLANPSFRLERGDAGVSHKFHQACVTHDLCYRHGLATYGHTQADCDFALQQAAFRLCPYQHDGDSREVLRCRIRAKIALLGVRFGGSKSYRGWDSSSYYEYENVLKRDSSLVIARSVPVSGTAPATGSETIRRFIPPVGVADRGDIRLERFQERGALLSTPVLLAQDPPLLTFVQRQSMSNTVSQVTSATLPERVLPNQPAQAGFRTDMYGSTPVVLDHLSGPRGPVLFALTPQRTQRLAGMMFDPASPCPPAARGQLPRAYTVWPSAVAGSDAPFWTRQQEFERTDLEQYVYRFFQQAPIAGPFTLAGGRIADVLITTHGRTHSGGGAMSGDDYRQSIDIIALGLKGERNTRHCTVLPQFRMYRNVPVDETMQPLVRLETRLGSGLIGMQKVRREGQLRLDFHEVWLNGPEAELVRTDPSGLKLDASFADRPPLVLKPGALDAQHDAALLLSRTQVVASTGPSQTSATAEIVRIQFVALAKAATGWDVSHAATCHVRYDFAPSLRGGTCAVSNPEGSFPFLPRRWTKPLAVNAGPSVGNQLRGSQMLAGRFARDGAFGIALMDACHAGRPVMVTPVPGRDGQPGSFAEQGSSVASRSRPVIGVRSDGLSVITHDRQVACKPLPLHCLAKPFDGRTARDKSECAGL